MTRNDLYDVAFRYKKAGLWKKLWDSEVFAIKLKNGEIGYVSIMGKNAYPQFIKYEPGYYPWKVQTKEDIDALYEAILASCLLADVLRTTTPETIGIISIDIFPKDIAEELAKKLKGI